MSRRARPLILGVVLALVTTSCALFSVPNDVGIKNVGVDLTFGGGLPTSPEGLPNFSLPPVPTLELPPVKPPPPPPPPPPPLCGPTPSTASPRERAVETMHADRNIPEEGNYPFLFNGNFENEPPIVAIENKVISNTGRFGNEGGFEFQVTDPFPGVRLGFRSLPITETDSVTSGLYFRKIEIPQETDFGVPRMLLFEPQQPLLMANFPIQQGNPITRSAPDVAPKSESPVNDPITGAPILLPSPNEITTTTTFHGRERVIVCEEIAQAWRVAWDIQITGEFNIRILGNFWLATQYGGWPIKDDYLVVGDLIPGNFSSNMLKIDPGDYI